MIFLAKATSIDGVTIWEGYYAEIKDGNEKVSVIIDTVKGVPHKILPFTLNWYTGVKTGKAQDIYSGDKVEVWYDDSSVAGVVEWLHSEAGWVIKDEYGDYYDLVGNDRYFVK